MTIGGNYVSKEQAVGSETVALIEEKDNGLSGASSLVQITLFPLKNNTGNNEPANKDNSAVVDDSPMCLAGCCDCFEDCIVDCCAIS